MKHWMVVCARGHCGTGHETEIKYAIKANTLLQALTIAKKMPSVKHTRMPLYGYEITEYEYQEYRTKSAYERYKWGNFQNSQKSKKKLNPKKRRH